MKSENTELLKNFRYIELQGSTEVTDSIHPDNKITTSKYTFFNFIPRFLMTQFKKPIMVWFLFISIIELTDLNENTTVSIGTIVPLGLIILLQFLRESFKFYKSFEFDHQLNKRKVPIWDGNGFVLRNSEDIKVGQIVLICNNESLPCDLLILSSGNFEHECYMETTNIFGESSIKIKHSIKDIQILLDSLEVQESSQKLKTLKEELFVPHPSENFRSFKAYMKLRVYSRKTLIGLESLLLCGSKLTNTPWIIGVVVYTGHETKLFFSNAPSVRESKISVILKKSFLVLFGCIFCVCLINTLSYGFSSKSLPYNWGNVLINTILLFSHILPISLFLSLELIQLTTAPLLNSPNISVNNPAIFPNLGTVEYIVADKTGTITDNNLHISFCLVNGIVYWENKESQSELFRLASIQIQEDQNESKDLQLVQSLNDLAETFAAGCENLSTFHFINAMAICNLAFHENNEFIALTAHDRELAKGASKLGIKIMGRDTDIVFVEVLGKELSFDVLGFQQFSLLKKRSRIAVRNRETGECFIYVKGDRAAMGELIEITDEEEGKFEGYTIIYFGFKQLREDESRSFQQEYLTAKQSPVNADGRMENVFEKFEKKLIALGLVGLEDPVSQDTQKTIKSLKQAGIKVWFVSGDSEEATLGAGLSAKLYGTEDPVLKLDNFTSELDFMSVVQSYIEKGIFDCEEVISNSSLNEINGCVQKEHNEEDNLRTKRSEMKDSYYSKHESFQNGASSLAKAFTRSRSRVLSKMRRATVNPFISKITIRKPKKLSLKKKYEPNYINFVLSIDSTALEYSMCSKQHTKYFVSLLFAAKFVCFHSLYPNQKKLVVKILKTFFSFRPIVLALGNGICDNGMMQEADIGVSVKNQEKIMNVNGSDVVISHFSDLEPLLLVKGHSLYVQVSKLVLLSMYAMALLETELFLYNILSGFSAFPVIQKEFLVVYRLVVNIVPITGMCLLDNDSRSTGITPQAYKAGIFHSVLNIKSLISFCLLGVSQGALTFMLTFVPQRSLIFKGLNEDYLLMGGSMMIILTWTVFFSSLIETYRVNCRTVIVYFLLFISLIIATVPLSYNYTSVEGFLQLLGDASNVWIIIVFTVLTNLLVSYLFKTSRFVFFPSVLEKVRLDQPELSLRCHSRLENYKKSLKSVYRDTSAANNNIVRDSEKMSKFTLRFFSSYRESIYQNDKIKENSRMYKIILIMNGLAAIAYALYNIGIYHSTTSYLVFLIVYSTALKFTFIALFVPKLKPYTSALMILFLALTQVFYFLSHIVYNFHSTLDIYCYLPVLFIIGFSNYWLEMTISLFLTSSLVMISLGFYDYHYKSSLKVEVAISYIIIYFSIFILASTASYFIDHSGRLEYNLVQKVQIEIQKTKNILGYLLPSFVRKKVKQGMRDISENQGIVSVIFCDIYNFEDILEHYKSNELVAFLDDLFAKIDQKCVSSGCTKIETVGKTYMACAGLKDTENDIDPVLSGVSHARRAVEMGIAIINLCENTYLKNKTLLKVKVGINTGLVTAGVVGFHKPQFSLVGDTVNTASRMASLCPGPNQIQISESTRDHMRDTSGLTFSKNMINAKGKGQMLTYLVSILTKDVKSSNSPYSNFESLTRNRESKKITFYQISAAQKDSTNRRSSAIENLNEAILEDVEGFRKNETEQLNEIKMFGLGLRENEKESAFRVECCGTNLLLLKFGLIIRCFCDVVFLSLLLAKIGYSGVVEVYSISKIVIELLVLCVLYSKFSHYQRFVYAWALALFYLVAGTLRMVDFSQDSQVIFIDYLLYILQAALCSGLLFTSLFWSITLVAVAQVIISTTKEQMDAQTIISSIVFLITLLYTLYSRERKLRLFSRIKAAADKEMEKTNDLIQKMMPKNVVEMLKEQSHVTEEINDVTILYADIAGFTQWSSDKLPEEVVGMLSNLFTEFDHQCVIHDVYKVHTIGDCYVALGYTGNSNRNVSKECYNLAMFALQLVSTIEEVNLKHGISLNMRIGIHTGKITGGIAGTNIVRYDIYGKDVLLANKMESTGQLGKVHISLVTKSILSLNYGKEFKFIQGEKVRSPITNEDIPTYFLELNNNGM